MEQSAKENCKMRSFIILLLFKYYPVFQIKENDIGEVWSTHVGEKNARRVLMLKPERNRTLGRYRGRCAHNTRYYRGCYKEIG